MRTEVRVKYIWQNIFLYVLYVLCKNRLLCIGKIYNYMTNIWQKYMYMKFYIKI
ncbi:hypothetical protein C2G38_2126271 [Gigaspora rosea]|uniref:Uncharacterized protein n=1 Tax=Gigaspora rosea TaxID=44941 RepID=A0A397TZU9_9GLOM|nr:hypothetical protein C2G38_2126271 [Gigaspora rosea]